jgi:hypothetical protein
MKQIYINIYLFIYLFSWLVYESIACAQLEQPCSAQAQKRDARS